MARRQSSIGEIFLPLIFFIACTEVLTPISVIDPIKSALFSIGKIIAVLAGIAGICWFVYRRIKESSVEQALTLRTNAHLVERERNVEAHTSTSKPSLRVKWTLKLIQELEWKRFEDLCSEYFKLAGFTAEQTDFGADGGVDILLKNRTKDQQIKTTIVQCKAWSHRNVGVKVVRELYGVLTEQSADEGYVINSGGFTSDAWQFEKGKPLKLITGEALLKMILELPEEKQKSLYENVTFGDYTTPTCPQCGIKMVLRASKKEHNFGEEFWGCSNYPRCRRVFKII